MATDHTRMYVKSLTLKDMELAWERIRRSKRREVKDRLALRIYGHQNHVSKYLTLLMEKLRREEFEPSEAHHFYQPKSDRSLRRFAFLGMDDRVVYQLLCNALILNSIDIICNLNREARVFGNIPIESAENTPHVFEPPFNITTRHGRLYRGQYDRFRNTVIRSYEQFLEDDEESWLVRTDIRSFFPSVDHTFLLDLVRHKKWLPDASAYDLLQECLAEWTPDCGKGIPVGYECSDYIGNLYLHDLDVALHGFRAHRYVDDIYVFVNTYEGVKNVIHLIDSALDRLKLQRNTSKTEIRCLRDLSANELKRILSENLSNLANERHNVAAESNRQDELVKIWDKAYCHESASECIDGSITDIRQVAFVLHRLRRQRRDVQDVACRVLDHELEYAYQALNYLYRNYPDERFIERLKNILIAVYEPAGLKALALEFLKKTNDASIRRFVSDIIRNDCSGDWYLTRETLRNVVEPASEMYSGVLLQPLINCSNPHVEVYARWLIFEVTNSQRERCDQIQDMFKSNIPAVNVLGIYLTDYAGLQLQVKKSFVTSEYRVLLPDEVLSEIDEFRLLFYELFKIRVDKRFRLEDYFGDLSESLPTLKSISDNRLSSGMKFVTNLYRLVELAVTNSVRTVHRADCVANFKAALGYVNDNALIDFVTIIERDLDKEFLAVKRQIYLTEQFTNRFGPHINSWHRREGLRMRDQVFVCYARRDEEWKELVLEHLKPIKTSHELEVWSDDMIGPGEIWLAEIKNALRRAKVAVLLVTRSFLASDFINVVELPEIESAREQGELTIMWIPVKTCIISATPIARMQAAWKDIENTLNGMDEEECDKRLVNVCECIAKMMGISLSHDEWQSPDN